MQIVCQVNNRWAQATDCFREKSPWAAREFRTRMQNYPGSSGGTLTGPWIRFALPVARSHLGAKLHLFDK